jgi:hypothetical protein
MGHLLIGLNTVKDKKSLSKDILIRETIRMEGLMDSELTNGKTLQFIKEALKMVSDMEKANGS